MTIKRMSGTVTGLALLAAAWAGVAGSALQQSAPTVRADQQAAASAMAGPLNCSGSGQSNDPGCPGPANTNWG